MVSSGLNMGVVYDSIRSVGDSFVVSLIVFMTMFGLFFLMLVSMMIK